MGGGNPRLILVFCRPRQCWWGPATLPQSDGAHGAGDIVERTKSGDCIQISLRGREAELFQPVRVHVTPVQVAYPLFIRCEGSGAHLQTADDSANFVFALDLQVLESTGTVAIRRDDGFVVPGAVRKAEEIIAWPGIAIDARKIDAPVSEHRLYIPLRYLVSRIYRCAGG